MQPFSHAAICIFCYTSSYCAKTYQIKEIKKTEKAWISGNDENLGRQKNFKEKKTERKSKD